MKLIIALIALSITATALADTYVNGYVRSDGTYVQGYTRSSPNSSTYDNYSTKGNVNPYNGNQGTVDAYGTPKNNYSEPKPIQMPDPYRMN